MADPHDTTTPFWADLRREVAQHAAVPVDRERLRTWALSARPAFKSHYGAMLPALDGLAAPADAARSVEAHAALTISCLRAALRYDYDLAISFGGEDRLTARELASELRAKGWRVFLDEDEKAELAGKLLPPELLSVYGTRSRYCLVLASQNYWKWWTELELKAALEADRERWPVPYLLVLQIDKTQVPHTSSLDVYLRIEDGIPHLCTALDEKLHSAIDREGGAAERGESSRLGPRWLPTLRRALWDPGGFLALLQAYDAEADAFQGALAFGPAVWWERDFRHLSARVTQAAFVLHLSIQAAGWLVGATLVPAEHQPPLARQVAFNVGLFGVLGPLFGAVCSFAGSLRAAVFGSLIAAVASVWLARSGQLTRDGGALAGGIASGAFFGLVVAYWSATRPKTASRHGWSGDVARMLAGAAVAALLLLAGWHITQRPNLLGFSWQLGVALGGLFLATTLVIRWQRGKNQRDALVALLARRVFADATRAPALFLALGLATVAVAAAVERWGLVEQAAVGALTGLVLGLVAAVLHAFRRPDTNPVALGVVFAVTPPCVMGAVVAAGGFSHMRSPHQLMSGGVLGEVCGLGLAAALWAGRRVGMGWLAARGRQAP